MLEITVLLMAATDVFGCCFTCCCFFCPFLCQGNNEPVVYCTVFFNEHQFDLINLKTTLGTTLFHMTKDSFID